MQRIFVLLMAIAFLFFSALQIRKIDDVQIYYLVPEPFKIEIKSKGYKLKTLKWRQINAKYQKTFRKRSDKSI